MATPPHNTPTQSPDQAASQRLYRQRCGYYDWQLAPYEHIRAQAIALLQLQPGQTVLDVGCGTGMSLERLQQAVGLRGQVVAVDQCADMLEHAHQRVRQHGWANVQVTCSPIERSTLPAQADAVLFHFTHDILQTPAAVAHVLRHLKPGARVVATGLKWTSPLYGGMNALVWWNAVQSVTTLQGLDMPWRTLEAQGVALDITTCLLGTIYTASGQLKA